MSSEKLSEAWIADEIVEAACIAGAAAHSPEYPWSEFDDEEKERSRAFTRAALQSVACTPFDQAKIHALDTADGWTERARQAIAYSRNFATAKPDIGTTEREHILGLCDVLQAILRTYSDQSALVMYSAVSARNHMVYGIFERAEMADAVGQLLMAADSDDHPEWMAYGVQSAALALAGTP